MRSVSKQPNSIIFLYHKSLKCVRCTRYISTAKVHDTLKIIPRIKKVLVDFMDESLELKIEEFVL